LIKEDLPQLEEDFRNMVVGLGVYSPKQQATPLQLTLKEKLYSKEF
jgi:hypothetical protein